MILWSRACGRQFQLLDGSLYARESTSSKILPRTMGFTEHFHFLVYPRSYDPIEELQPRRLVYASHLHFRIVGFHVKTPLKWTTLLTTHSMACCDASRLIVTRPNSITTSAAICTKSSSSNSMLPCRPFSRQVHQRCRGFPRGCIEMGQDHGVLEPGRDGRGKAELLRPRSRFS